MDLICFEDLNEGDVTPYGGFEVTKAEIVAFASEYDPQPFHLDEDAAKGTMLGGLAASGWHTAAINMRMTYDAFLKHSTSMGGPGIDELKWLKPVRPGDRLTGRMHVMSKRESKSRPEMGLVRLVMEVLNQAEEVVMTQDGIVMFGRRGHAEVPGASEETSQASTAFVPEISAPETRALYFEDLDVGTRTFVGSETFAKADIIRFGKAYDPQPFHVDEAAAARSHFGRLAASGWQTGACWMKHAVRLRQKTAASLLAQGIEPPALGPSPGFRNLKWLHPVYAGDTVHYASELTSKRATSRGGWGVVTAHNTGTNQNGRLVFAYDSAVFWPMRP